MTCAHISGLCRRTLAATALACCAAGATSAQTPPAANRSTAYSNSASATPAKSSGTFASPKSPGTNPSAANSSAPKSSAALEALKQRDLELESLRAEQRKAAEAEQKLAIESDSIAQDRRKLSQSLIDTAARIRTAEERVGAAELRLRQIESDEADIRVSLGGRRAIISEVLAALQRLGHRPPPAVFTGPADAIESLRTAMTLGAVLPQMRGETDKLLSDLAELTQLKNTKAVERGLLGTEVAELGDAQKRMSRLIEERQKRQAEIEIAIGGERQRVLALAQEADNLKDLIAKLERGLDAVSRAARARQGEDLNADELHGGPTALNGPARLAPAIAFVAAKGKLPLPASGVRVREFGTSDGTGGSEKGISLATRPGAQVTAPSDGWVVYAAPYRSYGQLLILNVGGGYHVLLAGMERITVDLGQFVLTGEPVAVMGSGTQVASNSAAGSPGVGSTEPVLYIEFRKDGTPIDPGPWWMATENEKVRG
jgi:septal ring factor EnvC (AmiA/AmiB activator)